MSDTRKDTDRTFRAPFHFGRHQVAGIWRYLLPEEIQDLRVPDEQLATCDNCYRSALDDFRDDCRCCTHFPEIPNYLLGLALQDETTRDPVVQQIATGEALPSGLFPSPGRFRSTVLALAKNGFGTDRKLLCPFMADENHQCRVYPYRNSVCSTYFCKNDHGDTGVRFWEKVQNLFGHLETTLARWAMTEVGLDAGAFIGNLDNLAPKIGQITMENGGWSRHAREKLWGPWLDKECAFFEKCTEVVTARSEELYAIAAAQPFEEPRVYQQALRDWIPAEFRREVPKVPDAYACPNTTNELLYKVQLVTRQLWELPFNEGTVTLNPRTKIGNIEGKSPGAVVGENRYSISLEKEERPILYATDADFKLLELFKTSQTLGELIFERAEVENHDDPRGFLARCLRQKILIHQAAG